MRMRRLTAMILISMMLLTALACEPAGRGADNSAIYGAPVEFSGEAHEASVFFVYVGKADCAVVKVDSAVWLVDTGTDESFPELFAALELMGAEEISGVLLTHEHSDHIGGLVSAAARLPVGKVICPEFVTDRSAILTAAAEAGLEVTTVRAGDSIPVTGDVAFRVLAPSGQIAGDGNDNSLVVKLAVNGRSFLFTGDMQTAEDASLLASGADVKCDVLKVPNHGNPDATSAEFAAAADPLISVISTDRRVDRDSANPLVKARLSNSEIYVTQDHPLGVRVDVSKRGEITLSFPIRPETPEGITLAAVSKAEQTFTVRNDSAKEVDISRWSVYSTRGFEVFTFPEGTVLAPGEDLLVACRKSARAAEADLVWDIKKAWADSKEDIAVLIDAYGGEAARKPSE